MRARVFYALACRRRLASVRVEEPAPVCCRSDFDWWAVACVFLHGEPRRLGPPRIFLTDLESDPPAPCSTVAPYPPWFLPCSYELMRTSIFSSAIRAGALTSHPTKGRTNKWWRKYSMPGCVRAIDPSIRPDVALWRDESPATRCHATVKHAMIHNSDVPASRSFRSTTMPG